MAFGCGVLISAVAYDLIMDGFEKGGLWPILAGAVLGSAAYTLANVLLNRRGARHRKRSGDQQANARSEDGGGLAIAVGSLLDGIPESIVLGVGLLTGDGISVAILAAIILSNFPEGLSSAVGMKGAGHGRRYILGLWGGIAIVSGLASMSGAALFSGAPPELLAVVNAVAAGALLTMITDTMIPEAVDGEGEGTGALVVLGLLTAFTITQLGG